MANKAIVGEKLGMTQVWDDDNNVVPVTVLRVAPARVVQLRTPERDGYSALQVTYGHRDARKLTKPLAGHYAAPASIRASASSSSASTTPADYQVGQEIAADMFEPGERIDVTAVSKGKGFAGVDEASRLRGSARLPRRAPGAPQARRRRPVRHPVEGVQGHADGRAAWAARQVTTLNLEIVRARPRAQVVLVKGSVPGPKGGVVLVRDAIKSRAVAKGGAA